MNLIPSLDKGLVSQIGKPLSQLLVASNHLNDAGQMLQRRISVESHTPGAAF